MSAALKPAYQKDETFLRDVRQTLSRGVFRLWWLGQSGFLLVNRGRALLLDPYLSDSLTRKYDGTDKPHERITERVVDPAALGALGVIDAVTSSHLHTDHLDRETLEPILAWNPQASLVVPEANRAEVLNRLGSELDPRIVGIDAGVAATIGGVEFIGIPAAHNQVERDAQGRCRFLGYILRFGNRVFYHSGDTLWHEGLEPILRPLGVDIAFLPINGNRPERRVAGNLDGREAARLAKNIQAKLAIPCHFDLFQFNTASPLEFASECDLLSQPYRLLLNGEGMDLQY
jgi:L-ascorbate metabolism protein UlaG (beta-lactamase superfamily)